MSDFEDFSFRSSNPEATQHFTDFTDTAKDLVTGLKNFLEPYKPIMVKEFNALDKNNKEWKKKHNTDCEAFVKKQWALSAPFNALKIIEDLYVNRKK